MATLSGYAPGGGTWFRVTASNSVGLAMPSADDSIYRLVAPAAPVLRVA